MTFSFWLRSLSNRTKPGLLRYPFAATVRTEMSVIGKESKDMCAKNLKGTRFDSEITEENRRARSGFELLA